MPDRTKRKRKWLIRLAVMTLVLIAVGGGGWYGLQRAVKSSLVAQLTSLGLGMPEIRSVSISLDGIHARQIRFLSAMSGEPQSTLDVLVIHHSLFELITSSPTYDAIDLVGLSVNVDYPFAADAPSPEIDLKSLALPAKKLSITQSNFVLQNGPERTFEIREVDLTITSNGDKLEASGVIGSMIGGPWKVSGLIEPKSDSLSIDMTTDRLSLVNHRWQKWPFIPVVIEQTVHGDALMKARVSIQFDAQNGLDVTGLGNIQALNLKFPFFDNLPVNIYEGDIEFRNLTVYYKDIVATVDGVDQIRGNGETTVDSYPIKVKFQGDFRDLEMSSLRKLVAGIPDNVQGKAIGDVVGLIDVEASTRTILDITADAEVQTVRFGQIETEKLRNETRIVDLVFDENQAFESVDGRVSVFGKTLSQPINRIFDTFELTELERRLELIGDFVADLEIGLPLATISDLTTWKLDVTGSVEEATICDQPISGVDIEARLNEGELQFRPINAIPLTVAEADQLRESETELPKLAITVDWPLVESGDAAHGRVWVSGEQVPTGWIRRFTDQQIENATGLSREAIDPDHRWAFEMDGQINLQTEIEIPVEFPDALEMWKGTGSVQNSTVTFDRLALGDLAASLKLEKGLLSIRDASGSFENGGQITATGHIDVRHQLDHQMDFTGRRLPFSWATMLAADASDAMKQAMVESNIDEAINNGELGGELSVDLKLSTDPGNVESPWSVRSNVSSGRLNIGDAYVTNLKIEGSGNSNVIQVDRFHADLPEDGFLDVQGKFFPESGAADGTIEWQKLPISWLSRFAKLNWADVDGRAHGKLSFRSQDITGLDLSHEIPVEIEGEISADPLRFGDVGLRPLAMNIATRNGMVHFENLRTADIPGAIGLRGEISLSGPHSFAVAGDIEQEQLYSLVSSASDTETPTSQMALAGILSTKFGIDGQLQPFDLQTNGNLSLTALVVAGLPLGDVSAAWNHAINDWSKTAFSVQAMEGTINLTELSNQPERLKLEVAGIDLFRLNSIVASGIPVSGTLDGSLALNEWNDRQNSSADLLLNSTAIRSGDVEFRDMNGQAEYRNQILSYGIEADWLGNKVTGNGQVKPGDSDLRELKFPLAVRAARLSLQGISTQSKAFQSLQSISGSLSAIADLELQYGQALTGIGRLELNDLGWKGKRLVKEASTRFAINNGNIVLEDFRGDLEQGTISGRMVIPTNKNAPGSYEFEIRQMDLGELTKLTLGMPTDVEGQFSARFNGRWDRQISGQGFVGVQRASIHGLEGQAFRLPVRFSFSPQGLTGRIEFRQSTFRLFDGKATASAIVNFGRTLSFDSNFQFANVDTGKLLEAIADIEQADQGKMSGRLALSGRGVRSMRDIGGTFNGQLTRASAFELPVLQDMARFLSGNNIKTQDYSTDQIEMRLDKGRIEIKQLNFTNALAKIAIRGNAYLDGRLDLKVAARVDKLGQPTLIEEIAGSPLAGLSGSPVAVIIQAAEFLSERVVFLRVNGTFRRPQVRIDTGQQLADEVIRYFLRGSQILPNGLRRND